MFELALHPKYEVYLLHYSDNQLLVNHMELHVQTDSPAVQNALFLSRPFVPLHNRQILPL